MCGIKLSSHAQDLDTLAKTYIWFDHNAEVVDQNYLGNHASLASIREALEIIHRDSLNSISTIVVEGAASPLGGDNYNQRLSLSRAQTVASFLKNIPEVRDGGYPIRLVAKGEDWVSLWEDVQKTYTKPNKDILLALLRADAPNYIKEDLIKDLDNSRTWNILVNDYMKSSRHVAVYVLVKSSERKEILARSKSAAVPDLVDEPTPSPAPAPISAPSAAPIQPEQKTESKYENTPIYQPKESSKEPQPAPVKSHNLNGAVAAFRTNLLVPAMNVGLELPVSDSWSFAADYYFPWIWPSQKNKNCFEFLGLNIETRYWFGRDRQAEDRLKGHSLGFYVAAGYYDFEKNYRGMQGEFASTGLDYTYSMAVGRKKNLNLQFSVSLGYIRSMGTTYNVYGDYGALYPDEGRVKWDYVGPTKVAVNLSLPLQRKEGRK